EFSQTPTEQAEQLTFWETMKAVFRGAPRQTDPSTQRDFEKVQTSSNGRTIIIGIRAQDLVRLLHELDPVRYPAELTEGEDRKLSLPISAPEFAEFRQTTENQRRPVTLNVQEAFMTYLKVSGVAGLVLASPWIFYQLWLFVAAGLYRHERQFVYKYLPISIGLFLGGAVFCFFVVFPFILRFLLGFNKFLGLLPQIRISEWINFAIMLPLMFGISFQLPLIMLFLERISIFDANDYREKRRLAMLVISVLSMLLTPSDPGSMIAMMLPLLALYELGIWMCTHSPSRTNPFAEET
ncbi:MAG TPA: twin-arginine translocase subunit TatC, partial [Planctomycetaceae bacterium]|nr:twin-arginine translocase subunit TatC [Planctomycetaceae bacterium]